MGYNKETIIEGVEGREGNKEMTWQWQCHPQIDDVTKQGKEKKRKEQKRCAVTDHGKYCD